MANLTKRQQEIHQLLQDHFENGYEAPNFDELCRMLGLTSRGSLHKHIQALVNEGLVEPLNGKQRGIHLISAKQPECLPYLGKIAAGKPIEAIENPTPILVPEHLRTQNNCYVLKITGDSMIEEGIIDGDWVVIEQTNTARNGEIVVALIDESEATLKTFEINRNKINLIPANSEMKTMEYDAHRVKIQGKLVGQMRSYQ